MRCAIAFLTSMLAPFMQKKPTVLVNVVNRHKENTITGEVVNNSGDFTGKAGVN